MTRREAMATGRCCWGNGRKTPAAELMCEPVCGAERTPGSTYCAEHYREQWWVGTAVHYTRIADSCRWAWTADMPEKRHLNANSPRKISSELALGLAHGANAR
jgi:hypothetical protein